MNGRAMIPGSSPPASSPSLLPAQVTAFVLREGLAIAGAFRPYPREARRDRSVHDQVWEA